MALSDDILPPVPPGEKLAHEKKGFFGLFRKKQPAAPTYEEKPELELGMLKQVQIQKTEPKIAHHESNINIDKIRQQLGLIEADEEIPEPPAMSQKPSLDDSLDLPDITMPTEDLKTKTKPEVRDTQETKVAEHIDFTQDWDDEVSEPPRLSEAKPAKEISDVPLESDSEWTSFRHDVMGNLQGKDKALEEHSTQEKQLEVQADVESLEPASITMTTEDVKLPDYKELELTDAHADELLLTKKRPELKTVPEVPKEILTEMSEKANALREEIKQEEKDKLQQELKAEREKLKKERQEFEQEKIASAGKANKTDFKEKQLLKAQAEVEEEKKKLKQEREALAEEKEKIAREKAEHKAIAQELPHLRKEHEALKATVEKHAEKIKLNEQIEENMQKREAALKETQKNLEEIEQRIKDEGFSDYLETELNGNKLVTPKFTETKDLKDESREIYYMVDKCKSLIWKEQLPEAQELYMKIRDIYNNVGQGEPEKEMLYTIIRELYDDIHLASMNQK